MLHTLEAVFLLWYLSSFTSIGLAYTCLQLLQTVMWTAREKLNIKGINVVRYDIITPLRARWHIFFIVFFKTVFGREHLRKIWKKPFDNFFFWGIILISSGLTAIVGWFKNDLKSGCSPVTDYKNNNNNKKARCPCEMFLKCINLWCDFILGWLT